jgi:hypothetical protein
MNTAPERTERFSIAQHFERARGAKSDPDTVASHFADLSRRAVGTGASTVDLPLDANTLHAIGAFGRIIDEKRNRRNRQDPLIGICRMFVQGQFSADPACMELLVKILGDRTGTVLEEVCE